MNNKLHLRLLWLQCCSLRLFSLLQFLMRPEQDLMLYPKLDKCNNPKLRPKEQLLYRHNLLPDRVLASCELGPPSSSSGASFCCASPSWR